MAIEFASDCANRQTINARMKIPFAGLSCVFDAAAERWRSPSRRQNPMIRIPGQPATWVDRFILQSTLGFGIRFPLGRIRHKHEIPELPIQIEDP